MKLTSITVPDLMVTLSIITLLLILTFSKTYKHALKVTGIFTQLNNGIHQLLAFIFISNRMIENKKIGLQFNN